MIRYAAAALCLTLASPAFAGDQSLYPHTHGPGYVGSFTNPINYRPNKAPGMQIVRSPAYNEADSLIAEGCCVGKSDTVTSVISTTVYGQGSGTPVIMLGGNVPSS